MPDLNQIEALIARVEAATGPSREIDALLHEAAYQSFEMEYWAEYSTEQTRNLSKVPPYTTSLDSIVGLIERQLPGWTIASIGQNDSKKWHCELREGYQTSYKRVVIAPLPHYGAPNAALATTSAFLRALHSKEQP